MEIIDKKTTMDAGTHNILYIYTYKIEYFFTNCRMSNQ